MSPPFIRLPWTNLATTTATNIILDHIRIAVLELQSNPAPHHAHAVDGVDQCVSLTIEHISVNKPNHYDVIEKGALSNIPVLVEHKLEGRKGKLCLKEDDEFVFDGASPEADQDHEAVHDPGDATARGSGVVTRELFLLPDIFVRFRIDDERQPIASRRFYLIGRHFLLPDTEKRM